MNNNSIICNNCKYEYSLNGSSFVCVNCTFLNPITSYSGILNYFSYLSLKPQLTINLIELEKLYTKFMILYHPDKFVIKSNKQQAYAVIHSSYLNNAYSVLTNDLSRFAHLYFITYNEDIIDDDKALNKPALMMEFLDLYEELDLITNSEQTQLFLNKLNNMKQAFVMNINSIKFSESKDTLKNIYIKLKYIEKIITKATNKWL